MTSFFFEQANDLPETIESVYLVRRLPARTEDEHFAYVGPGVIIEDTGGNSEDDAATIKIYLFPIGNRINVASTDVVWAKHKAEKGSKSVLRLRVPGNGYFNLRKCLQIFHGIILTAAAFVIARYLLRLAIGTFPMDKSYCAVVVSIPLELVAAMAG